MTEAEREAVSWMWLVGTGCILVLGCAVFMLIKNCCFKQELAEQTEYYEREKKRKQKADMSSNPASTKV